MKHKIDLSAAKPYLEALDMANHLPYLMDYIDNGGDANLDYMLDDAMDQIDEWCPWLWPQIDRVVLNRAKMRAGCL